MNWGLGNNINNKISFIELFKQNFNCCRVQNVEFITDKYLQPNTRTERFFIYFLKKLLKVKSQTYSSYTMIMNISEICVFS